MAHQPQSFNIALTQIRLLRISVASQNPNSLITPEATAEIVAQLIAQGVNPQGLQTILQSATPSISTPTDSAVAREVIMLEELQEDSHSQRRIRKGSSIVECSAGKHSKPYAPLSARKNLKSTRQPALTITKEGDSDGSAGESEEAGRAIVQELVLDREWLVEYKLGDVQELLVAQGWGELFIKPVLVDEKLVKEFYSKLKLVEKSKGNLELSVNMGGEVFTLNQRELATILQVPKGGYAEYTKGTWPSSMAKSDVFDRLGMDLTMKGQRETSGMDVLPRILQRIRMSNITPRKQKHNLVVFQDMLLMDQIMQRKPVNLPFQVMRHMEYNKENPSNGLPFPQFVKDILKYWEIYNHASETALSTALSDEHIVKLGLEYSAHKGWMKPRAQSPPSAEPADAEMSLAVDPVRQDTALPADEMGVMMQLLRDIRSDIQEVKGRLVALEVAAEKVLEVPEGNWVNALGAAAAVIEGFPKQLKKLTAEIVEQLKVPSQTDA